MLTDGISGASSTSGNESSYNSASAVNKDEFLKLLTYQLKSQNPLNPMENQEFAAQLAQFSQLEQLTGIRSLMEDQTQIYQILTQTIANSALPGLLGKTAKAISSQIYYDGENEANISYNLPYAAESATLTISDENGNVVRTMQLSGSELTSGDHSLAWNGENNDGEALSPGKYGITVEATDESGASFTADTFAEGKIQRLRFKDEGTFLVVGGLEIPLENVVDIATATDNI